MIESEVYEVQNLSGFLSPDGDKDPVIVPGSNNLVPIVFVVDIACLEWALNPGEA